MKHNIQNIFNKFINKYLDIYNPNYNQTKVISKITTCRTNKQGIRIYKCNNCHKKIYTYISCKDRHCPTCLEYKKEFWLEKHKQDILDINYYHIVISIPKELKYIFYYNQKTMYNEFLKISNEELIKVIKQTKNIDIGTTSILHTWSQLTNYFPHIHILLTGGGINNLGKWQSLTTIDKDLIINKISKRLTTYIKTHDLLYYGKYSYLKQKEKLIPYLDNISKDKWNIHINPPYKSVLDIYEYFAKYAFRVCITNERIKNITDTHVTFTYKDKNNRNIIKERTIKGEEFIRKFLMHSLPKSFIKIRYYGILSGKNKTKKMKKIKLLIKQKKQKEHLLTKIELLNKINGKDVTTCTFCQKGTYYLYKEIYKNKSPPKKDKDTIKLTP